jgi:hypothetical protein
MLPRPNVNGSRSVSLIVALCAATSFRKSVLRIVKKWLVLELTGNLRALIIPPRWIGRLDGLSRNSQSGREAGRMSQVDLQDVGFRWTKPTWERAADRTWLLIVPSSMSRTDEGGGTTDPRLDRSQRMYEIFEFDGTWVDQLHEMQVESILLSPRWRRDLAAA